MTSSKKLDPAHVAELLRRHERARRDALKWMRRHRSGHQVLADRISVCRCTLTKFLNDDPGFRPTPDRPAKVRILEKLEEHFATYEFVHERPLEPPRADPPDDEYTLAYNHEMRLRQLSNNFDGLQGLRLVGELCAQAIWGPPGYRAGMAARTLLRIAGFVSRPESKGASRSMLQHTMGRIRALEEAARLGACSALAEDSRQFAAHRALGYAGYGLSWCGLHLPDDDAIVDGLRWAHAAAARNHAREDGHWPNLLRLCDELLTRHHRLADETAEHVANLAAERWDAVVSYALTHRTYTRLTSHWRQTAPELLKRLPTEGQAR